MTVSGFGIDVRVQPPKSKHKYVADTDYVAMGNSLCQILRKHDCVPGSKSVKSKAEPFRLLCEVDGVSKEQVFQTLKLYELFFGNEYCPFAATSEKFRAKYADIRHYCLREKKRSPLTKSCDYKEWKDLASTLDEIFVGRGGRDFFHDPLLKSLENMQAVRVQLRKKWQREKNETKKKHIWHLLKFHVNLSWNLPYFFGKQSYKKNTLDVWTPTHKIWLAFLEKEGENVERFKKLVDGWDEDTE